MTIILHQGVVIRASIRRALRLGTAASFLLVGGIGGWACMTTISGAVIAGGTLVVNSNVKKVQHPVGGVVGALNVRDGDSVAADDVLMRLDDTQMRANLAMLTGAIDEMSARAARDEAERDGVSAIAFPQDLLARQRTNAALARMVESETRLFKTRAEGRAGQEAQLREQIGQLDQEISGLIGQTDAKVGEIDLIDQELAGVRDLWHKNLIPVARLNALQRDEVRIRGEMQDLVAKTASARGKKAEINLRILQIYQDLRTEVGKDLADIHGKSLELNEKKIIAEDNLGRTEIRAAQAGIVHELAVHTIGGVVTAGEPIMLIVPDQDRLIAEVKVDPKDIAQLSRDQQVVLHFPAFDSRTTPTIRGTIVTLSPDTTLDQHSGKQFYTARIDVPAAERKRLAPRRLVPGMPIEAFFQTGDRTIMSYLTKPLVDQIATAWREK